MKYKYRKTTSELGRAGSMKRLLENLKISDKSSLNIVSPKSFGGELLEQS